MNKENANIENSHNDCLEKQTQFLLAVLESEEQRRQSIDTKLSILTAANAFLFAGIIGFGAPQIGSQPYLYWSRVSLMILSILFILFSLALSLDILKPMMKHQQREKYMDLGSTPFSDTNLFFFLKIAKLSKSTYTRSVASLNANSIFEELASEVHNVSRLLKLRYQKLQSATLFFMGGLFAYALLSILKIFSV